MVVHTLKPSTWEAEVGGFLEFKASQDYMEKPRLEPSTPNKNINNNKNKLTNNNQNPGVDEQVNGVIWFEVGSFGLLHSIDVCNILFQQTTISPEALHAAVSLGNLG